MNIDEAYRFLFSLANKSQTGGIFTPAQFNLNAQRAQIEFYNSEYKKWRTNSNLSDSLRTFVKPLPISVPANGKYTLPDDFYHVASMRKYYVKQNNKGIEVPIREEQQQNVPDLLQSEVRQPTLRFPIGVLYDSYIEFFPHDIGLVKFEYFRRPKNPVWNYTLPPGGTVPVYDPTTSVDFEFDDEYTNQIVLNIADYFGINVREPELVQWVNKERQQQEV